MALGYATKEEPCTSMEPNHLWILERLEHLERPEEDFGFQRQTRPG